LRSNRGIHHVARLKQDRYCRWTISSAVADHISHTHAGCFKTRRCNPSCTIQTILNVCFEMGSYESRNVEGVKPTRSGTSSRPSVWYSVAFSSLCKRWPSRLITPPKYTHVQESQGKGSTLKTWREGGKIAIEEPERESESEWIYSILPLFSVNSSTNTRHPQ
jgi:hypothetical protein